MAFEPRPTFNAWNRQQQIGLALDTPFTFSQALAENFQQGILDSFGLGTTARAAIAGDPRQTTGPEGLGNAIRGVGELLGTMRPDQSKTLSKTEYEASPWFRDSIQWDEAFTEDRAAALAAMYDKKAVRARFSERQPVAAFLGQLGGQALDPVNYVPVFGAGVTAAAVARFGSIAGRALISASEAAINTAAFGVLTSGIRAKYGDDTSWQSIATEVAMSAVIGGAFGGGIGLLARGVDRRAAAVANARPKLETIGNVMESRAVLNDAVTGLIDRAEVNLVPNSLQAVERMSDEVVARTSGIRALRDETAKVTGMNAGEVVISPSGARVSVRPEVVEARSLIRASGDLQVRDRSSPQSRQQVEDIAINLDPARLMPNVDASQGAPLVGPDGVIDSGNGRVMALTRAYEAYPEKAQAYRQALIDAGYADAANMQEPVLISRRLTELTPEARAQFNAEVNGPTTARMTAVELAAMDRGAVTDGVLDVLDDAPVTAASNRAAVGRFLANLPANERGAMVDGSGALSADGARRVENALVAAAYGDADTGVLRRFAEATDDNTRTIVGALSDVAGQWARMRRDIKAGTISPDFDMTPELTQAVRLLGRWREDAAREGRPVSQVIREGLAQLDLLDGSISPEAQTFIRMFYQNDHFAKAVGREVLAARLQRVITATNELGRPSLFGDGLMPSKGEVLTNAQREQADIFTADGLEPRPEAQRGSGEGDQAGGTGGADRSGVEGGDNLDGIASAFPPAAVMEKVRTAREFVASQPARSLDETYAVIPEHQQDLDAFGRDMQELTGAEWRNPGIKDKASAAEKMARKGYESTAELTDLVRGGFVVDTPAAADEIVRSMQAMFGDVLDEGWRMTAVNYFDRKVLVRFDDGTIGEVQFWHPDMINVKESRGHALYEEARALEASDPSNPRLEELFAEQRRLYASALPETSPAWSPVVNGLLGKSSTPGNAARNAASLMGSPESITSTRDASFQPEFDLGTNSADAPSMMAARPSQLKNLIDGAPDVQQPLAAIDGAAPAPDPVPDGLPAAEARIGKGEDMRQLAESHGVSEDGSYVEQADIEQLRATGALTPEDEAELAAADQLVADADAYADTLAVAARCVIS